VNVVLITIDTLRAGNLSAYGYSRPTSPRLEGLARQGVLFENCYSAANVTTPSHTSILTGTRVTTHGVDRNSARFAAEEIPTLAERYRRAGYATAAVVSVGHLNRASSGLGRGFDAYFDAGGERRVGEAVGLARQWIAANAERPFFLWVHVFDPHMAYDPPPPYDALYVKQRSRRIDALLGRADKRDVLDDERLGEKERSRLAGIFALRAERAFAFDLLGFTPAELEYLPALYDGEIAYTDASLGELFDDLERRNLSDDTLVTVTADHGEAFGEHGIYFSHRTVYEETLRVPLILRLPRRIPAGERVAALVSGIDIAPTLLHYSRLPLGEEMDGRSLAPLIDGWGEPPSEPILADHDHGYAAVIRDGAWKLIVSQLARRPRLRSRGLEALASTPDGAARIEGLLVVHPKRYELFNLADDPSEKRDVAAQHPEAVRRLLALSDERTKKRSRSPSRSATDPAALERLRALGYDE
jgi:arylsulfatase A-like enzyme